MNGLSHSQEQLVRDLMRGERSKLHRGYSVENAAIFVQERLELTDEAYDALVTHGLGFRDGVALALDPEAPVTVTDEHDWTDEQFAAYQRGLDRGRNERVPEEVLIG